MHYSVLVVDDEKELSEYTARYFNMSGLETAYVLDAKSALEFFEENTCSLVMISMRRGGRNTSRLSLNPITVNFLHIASRF